MAALALAITICVVMWTVFLGAFLFLRGEDAGNVRICWFGLLGPC
jgi:hypothetical protein